VLKSAALSANISNNSTKSLIVLYAWPTASVNSSLKAAGRTSAPVSRITSARPDPRVSNTAGLAAEVEWVMTRTVPTGLLRQLKLLVWLLGWSGERLTSMPMLLSQMQS